MTLPIAKMRPRRADSRMFDRGGRVAPPPWRDVAREAGALVLDLARLRRRAAPASLPRGDGHPVLVIPALFSSDRMTRSFRNQLAALGYRVEGWGTGINIGPTQSAWDITAERLRAMASQTGQSVTIIGHSLGGVLARALASERPELVRRVITICSPFRLPTASRLEPLYRMLSPWHIDEEVLLSRIAAPPPIPTTAIYTRRDGIVAWSSCIDTPVPGRENVAIDGAHATILGNPETIRVVVDHLTRPGSGAAPSLKPPASFGAPEQSDIILANPLRRLDLRTREPRD